MGCVQVMGAVSNHGNFLRSKAHLLCKCQKLAGFRFASIATVKAYDKIEQMGDIGPANMSACPASLSLVAIRGANLFHAIP